MEKGKKSFLTMQQRVDVLKDLETSSVAYVAEKYKVHPRTITRIQKYAAKVCNFAERGTLEKRRKNLRQSKYAELEQRLFVWFAERKAAGDILSDALLKQKASELKEEIEVCSNFKLSQGWLANFKRRYHIRLAHMYSAKPDVDEHGANLFVRNFEKYIQEEDINLENIYNMEETGLLWKALPSRTVKRDTEQRVSGYKIRKDRLTVGLCANATGTHKMTPLVIYKFKKPRALRDCMNQLPVIFKTQTNSWSKQDIFVDWFENHFKKAVRQYQLENGLCGKVILLVNNCTSYKFPNNYEHDDNFEVKFLPNTTSLIQPMDQGIIEKLKRRYRHKLSQNFIAYGFGIVEFYKTYTIKDSLHSISASWENLTCSDIKNAWKKIIPNMQTVEETEEDTITSEMQQAWSHISDHDRTVEDIENYFTACTEEERRLPGTLEERTAEEGVEEWDAEEGDEERAAEEGDEERAAEEGDEERAAEEGGEERVAEEGDEENGMKLNPKLRKDFDDVFEQFERLRKYLPPPERCFLEGLKLTILGNTASKKRKLR